MAYQLAAYDASGRRYWNSETVDFTMAPAPVGAWITASLTVMASYPCPCPVPGPSIDSLGAWWRADDAGTVNGAAVTTWAERSGSGAVLTVPAGVGAPTWIGSLATLNNQPAVNFAGAQGLRQVLPPGFIGGSQAVTIYVVIVQDALTSGGFFSYGSLVPPPPNAGCYVGMFSSVGLNAWGVDVQGSTSTTTPSLLPRIFSCRNATNATWNNSKLSVDGADVPSLVVPPAQALNIPSPVAEVCVGGVGTAVGSYVFQGKIAEILYYRKEQNANERAQTLLYLSSRYNIPLV